VSEPIKEECVLLLPDRGGSLKRLHRPNLLEVQCKVSRRNRGFNVTGINPDCPQSGPYEASEGIYPGRAIITGGGQGENLDQQDESNEIMLMVLWIPKKDESCSFSSKENKLLMLIRPIPFHSLHLVMISADDVFSTEHRGNSS
jgi:hypothetical protein